MCTRTINQRKFKDLYFEDINTKQVESTSKLFLSFTLNWLFKSRRLLIITLITIIITFSKYFFIFFIFVPVCMMIVIGGVGQNAGAKIARCLFR